MVPLSAASTFPSRSSSERICCSCARICSFCAAIVVFCFCSSFSNIESSSWYLTVSIWPSAERATRSGYTSATSSAISPYWTGSKKRCKRKPSRTDIRQALKLNWVYELPFGSKCHFLGNVHNPASQLLSWLAGTNLLFRKTPHLMQARGGAFLLSPPMTPHPPYAL